MMTMSEANTRAIAKQLIDAITAGDRDAIERLYHADLVGWQNFSGRELSRRQMVKIIGLVMSSVKDLRYDDIRVDVTPRGYVQQHVLRATAPDGRAIAVPACLVVGLSGDQIVRIDEYMDAAAIAPLLSATAPRSD